MKTTPELPLAPAGATAPAARPVMNGKPVFVTDSKSVINFKSHFKIKLLCDGLTFSTGSACAYTCSFCYVPDLIRKLRATPHMAHVKGAHEDIVIRRGNAIDIMRRQLTHGRGQPKFKDPADRRVIYSSPLVDVAANMDLVRETIEACKLIMDLTHWEIRLLSKSNLLPKIAEAMHPWNSRMIYGVSTGTLDDGLAKAFEAGTPLVSKRIQSLHWLQDNGFRTFGMICPSLPQADYPKFSREMAAAIRVDRCEHVWAEVINIRGESLKRTVSALKTACFDEEAAMLAATFAGKDYWENYARDTFQAHTENIPPAKLRFLQYVTPATKTWWAGFQASGAVLL